MAREIEIDTNKAPWTPTQWPGISRKVLRRDEQTGAPAGLLKFEADTRLAFEHWLSSPRLGDQGDG